MRVEQTERILIAATITIAAVGGCATTESTRQEPAADATVERPGFPGAVGDFRYREHKAFEDPRAGVVAVYATESDTASVFVYPIRPELRALTAAEQLPAGMNDANAELGYAVQQGVYERVDQPRAFSAKSDSGVMLVQTFVTVVDGQEHASALALRAHYGSFLKVRLTGPGVSDASPEDLVRTATDLMAAAVTGVQGLANRPERLLWLAGSVLDEPAEDESDPRLRALVQEAGESDLVTIQIDPRFLPLGELDKRQSAFLLAYFVAGAARFDLMHPELREDSLAEKPEALRASLVAYRSLREGGEAELPFYERVAAAEKAGTLVQLVRELADGDGK